MHGLFFPGEFRSSLYVRFRNGFLEALAQRTRTRFVYAEEATPAFYRPAFGPAQEAVAVAVRLDSSAWRWTGNPLSRECTFADFVSWLEGDAS